jgi:polysaccharide export outer membrane protein
MVSALILLCGITNFCLVPNDAVEILIWHQPDLSGKYFISKDTTLNIPLLGEMTVNGIQTDSLEKILIDRFRNFYGDIYLTVNFYFRISVFGEVKVPGYHYVKNGDNLTSLLAEAGGPTEAGNLGRVKIINLGRERVLNFEKIVKKGKNIEQLNLQPGDVVIVPRRFLPSFGEWGVLFTLGTLLLQVYLAIKT